MVLGLCLVTLWAARNFGGAERLIANTGVLGGPAGVAERFGRVMAVQARTPPIDASEDGGWFTAREPAFSRYVRACTRDDDGIIVLRSGGPVGLLFPYIAERRLAAGHPYWANGWRSSPEHQRESLTLWQRQSVPVVWLQDDAGDAIFRRYDLLYDHLARHYVAHTVAAGPNRAGFGGVWLDASGLATGVYEPLGLPCFR